MVSQTNISAFTDVSRFGALKSEAGKDPSNAVGKVAREFEALFIEMMLSSARKAAIKGGMFESHALELYKEMFDTQAARVLSEQGTLGFEQAISRFAGIPTKTDSAEGIHSLAPIREINATDSMKEPREQKLKDGPVTPLQRADLPLPNHRQHALNPQSAESIQPDTELKSANTRIAMQPSSTAQSTGAGATEQYQFSRTIAPYAAEAAKKLGTEPTILIAQAALETGWGAHVIPGSSGTSSNNLFGIKSNARWQGEASQVTTLEFLGGRPINTKASFRRYPDIKSAFEDYVSFVTSNPRYQKALASAGDGDSYIRELAKAGYATDPKYAEKVVSIKNRIEGMSMLADANSTASKTSQPDRTNMIPALEK